MCPSSVRAKRRVVRNNSCVPKCCSSSEICRLTEVSELGSDLAAADKLPASTTRTKVANAANWSIRNPSALGKTACRKLEIPPNSEGVYRALGLHNDEDTEMPTDIVLGPPSHPVGTLNLSGADEALGFVVMLV